jgi:hypothetical protein
MKGVWGGKSCKKADASFPNPDAITLIKDSCAE